MPRAMKVCSVAGCPELVPIGTGRCHTHERAADQARGTATERGYGRQHQRRFRPAVLRRDPHCVCRELAHGHAAPCLAASTVADHYPRSRRELVALGLDPNAEQYGRGICKGCHDRSTAASPTQRGGWHAYAQ